MSDTELTSMPKPARRIEIFTGAGRRRAWPAAAKAEIIAQIGVEGASVSAVARRHGLTPGQLFAWRREARRAMVQIPTESGHLFRFEVGHHSDVKSVH